MAEYMVPVWFSIEDESPIDAAEKLADAFDEDPGLFDAAAESIEGCNGAVLGNAGDVRGGPVIATTKLWAQMVNDPTAPAVRELCEVIEAILEGTDLEESARMRLRAIVQRIERGW